jgi:hypothetical protein
MMRRPVTLLVFCLALVACGPSARQQLLKTTFVATKAAQAGFVAWDAEKMSTIGKAATSLEDGVSQIAAHKEKRSEVVKAFETTYRVLAQAALLDEDQTSIVTIVGAFEKLRLALRKLTDGRLP